MRALNLYAGIGGNRKLWKDVDVTAVEHNETIAQVYADLFPNDELVIGDAHEYLLNHFDEFDFIWSSPPCQSHSSFRQNICVRYRGTKPVYPDMKLYQEVLFLQHNFDGLYVVENVKPYYDFLIQPTAFIQRHAFWANFDIPDIEIKNDGIKHKQIPQLQDHHGFDLTNYKIPNKRQVLRNCIYPPLGEHILNCVKGVLKCKNTLTP